MGTLTFGVCQAVLDGFLLWFWFVDPYCLVLGWGVVDENHACPMCGDTLANYSDINSSAFSTQLSQINSNYSTPSIFTNNAFASAMAFSDIVAYTTEYYSDVQSFNKRVGLNNATFERYELVLSKDENCDYCS